MSVRPPSPALRARAAESLLALEEAVPVTRCELDFRNPFELLIATILSAQTTDKTVNLVTPALFAAYPDAASLAAAEVTDVEALIKPTGFYKTKARNIMKTASRLVAVYGGAVPPTMEDLTTLAGVARKTANVVLGTAFGLNTGIAVDTHVLRVSKRLGLTKHTDPVKVEADLLRLFPQDKWTETGHRMVLFGRYTCLARKPHCAGCPAAGFCPSRKKLETPTKT